MRLVTAALLASLPLAGAATAWAEAPRCEIVPLAGRQVSMRIDGVEKTRWHHSKSYPRPFFFPFNGPSGESLTRMGHPGAPNHDHHRSVWFAHHIVEGNNFWADTTKAHVRQKQWLAYRDGDDEAALAVRTGWYNPAGKEVMEADIVAALRPVDKDKAEQAAAGEYLLELQITLRPPAGVEKVSLAKTNFGFLAVRMAKTMSGYFGGGTISSSEGAVGEKAIFGKRARWMDYSGPITAGAGSMRKTVDEGITYFDHPSNPGSPVGWHVREDGWMGAGFCMYKPYEIVAGKPLTLRYLLHSHAGRYNAATAKSTFDAFAARPQLTVSKAVGVPNTHFIIKRAAQPDTAKPATAASSTK